MIITRLVVVLLATLTLVACTSMRIVADGGYASSVYLQRQHSGLAANDRAKLTLADGRQMALKVASIDGNAVQGTVDGDDQFVSVPIGEVVRIERSQVNGARTTGLVVVTLLVGAAAALNELEDEFEDAFRTTAR